MRLSPRIVALFICLLPTPAMGGTLIVVPGKSLVRFTSKAPFETVTGKTGEVTGSIDFNPANAHSISGSVAVKAASIRTGNRLRDKNMHEDYLETGKYPEIAFRVQRIVSGPASLPGGGSGHYTLEGTFEIHGVRKKIIVPATVSADTAVGMGVKSEFVIGLSDFQIKRPSFLIMRLAEEVTVKVVLSLQVRH